MTALATPESQTITQPLAASGPLNLFGQPDERRDFASKLRAGTVACRVRHEKFGARKALTREQIKSAADEFAADPKLLSASKRLLDTADPAYRAVLRIRRKATSFWRSISTPYPEPGIRLIRKDKVDLFNECLTNLDTELAAAVKNLQEKYSELRDQAQQSLGTLFNVADYPSRIDDEFSLDWDFPSIEPPSYLKDLHPHLYEQECERIKGRFEEAVRLTEQALTEKFAELVAHLAERIKGDVDGKPKAFRDTAILNLSKFFEDFRNLDLGSNEHLQTLVNQAQAVIKGVTPDDLRASPDIRTRIATQLGEIQQHVDELMVVRPGRQIDLEDEETGAK